MTGVTALGPWPGHKVLKAQDVALTELASPPEGVVGMPPLVHMPKRGVEAQTTARTLALLDGLPAELGTHGWALTGRPSPDQARAVAVLREDLDALAVLAHEWTGPLVVSARGPWTLASTLWLARGDRVVSDRGAARELAYALAEGFAGLVRRAREAAPRAQVVAVLREPGLPDVLAGVVPTFSGHGRLPAVAGPDAAAGLDLVVAAARAAGAQRVVLHGGQRFASRTLSTMAATSADAVGLAAAALADKQWEAIAEVVERGTGLWLGLPRDHPRKGGPPVDRVARLVHRPWTSVGLPAAGLADLVVHTDTSGSGDQVLGNLQAAAYELRTAVLVARALAERAAEG